MTSIGNAENAAAEDLGLISLSASEMARQIAAGKLTSVELVEAHIRRIEAVNPALNAVVVPLFAQARAEAAMADEARRRGEPLGPLHGVPITVKECFHMAGTASTAGVVRFAGEIMSQDATLVRRLRRAGAIVLGKTNVPQLMLIHETDNPLYGRTNNPWDLERSPGGSSGGEAAIIAAGGSPLGLANDLGGSIRQPAHSCGLCGIKPTSLRLTNDHVRDNLHGMEAVRPQPGPLARHVEDLQLALRVLAQSEPDEIDPQVAPVPLLDPAQVRVDRLRIGMWVDDGFFASSPAIRRAVLKAGDALSELGAHVELFKPPRMTYGLRLYLALLSADGTASMRRILGHGPRDWRIQRMIRLGRTPRWLRAVMRGILHLAGQHGTAELLGWVGRTSADGYWQLTAARAAYVREFFAAWTAANLDAIVCPPHALPALRHGSSEHLITAAGACYWANLLGVPAGVVPVTRVGDDEQTDRPISRDLVTRAAKDVERGSAGLPVGVQVAARPWREDVVLAVMAALESHFRRQDDFPRTPISPPAVRATPAGNSRP